MGGPGDNGTIDFAGSQQLGKGFIGNAGDFNTFRQVQFHFLNPSSRIGAGLIPVHIGQFDAAVIVHPAAHIDGGGMGPFRRADALALQVLHGLDVGVLVYIERGKPEQPGTDNGQADDIGIVAGDLGGEFGQAQFGDIPFPVCRKTREHLMMSQR